MWKPTLQGVFHCAGPRSKRRHCYGREIFFNINSIARNRKETAPERYAAGNAYTEALNMGYSKEKARDYAILVGASEAALQYVLGGISSLGSKGGVSAKLASKINQIDNGLARFALTAGGNGLSEGMEEGLQAILEPIFRSMVTEESVSVDWGSVVYDALMGMLFGMVLGGDGETAVNAQNTLESGLNSAYDNVKTGEIQNGAEEIHIRESGQWADGKNTGRQISPVEEGAGRDTVGETGSRSADSETAALTYGREVSAASLGIESGTDKANVRLVTDGNTTATRAAKQMAREHNLQLVLFVGNNLEIKLTDGSVVSARALIYGEKVFVRADHAEFTADQLMGHETGHNRIARGEIDPNSVRRRIRQTFGGIKTVQLAAMYTAAYAGTGMTASEVWEEIICDSLGDMNIFAGTAREARAAQLLSAAKAASADARTESTRGSPSDKYSRETPAKKTVRLFSGKVNEGEYISLSNYEKRNIGSEIKTGRATLSASGKYGIVNAADRNALYCYVLKFNDDKSVTVTDVLDHVNDREIIETYLRRFLNGDTERGGGTGRQTRSDADGRRNGIHSNAADEKTGESNRAYEVPGRKSESKHTGNRRESGRNSENHRTDSKIKAKFSRELFPHLYAERLMSGNGEAEKAPTAIYAARLKELGRDYSNTIYADRIKAHEAELQMLIKEAEEVLSEESVSAAREQSISANARDKLGEITARGTTKIKQGFTAFSKDDVLFERAKLVRPDGNKFDVAMHGTSQSVAFGGRKINMSPRLLAAIIKHNKDYNGQEIRLLSCNTGKTVNGEYCFAEELANAIGVTVYAPNDLLIFYDDGTFEIGRNNEGRFIPYKPNERRRLK